MEEIIIKHFNSFTVLTLNRPEKRNALNKTLLKQLCEAIEFTQKLPDQRAFIITGNGLAFCAGMDLLEAKDPKNLDPLAHLIAQTLTKIYSSSLVTIAAVNGTAVGGGAGIMSACDFVIAAKETKIGYPEIGLGIVPAQVSALLARQVPWRIRNELLLLGELIDTQRALEIGLINQIVSSETLLSSATELAEKVAKNNAQAIGATKKLLRKWESEALENQLQLAVEVYLQSKDAKEGIASFFSK